MIQFIPKWPQIREQCFNSKKYVCTGRVNHYQYAMQFLKIHFKKSTLYFSGKGPALAVLRKFGKITLLPLHPPAMHKNTALVGQE